MSMETLITSLSNVTFKLGEMPVSGVFLVADDDYRNIYVGYSSRLARRRGEWEEWAVQWMEAGGQPLRFQILSVCSDIETMKIHTSYWRDRFMAAGSQELVKAARLPVQYRARSVVSPDFKYCHVELVTSRGDGKVVGRFNSRRDADAFIMDCYGEDNEYSLPVYAANSLTREFLAREREALNKIKLHI